MTSPLEVLTSVFKDIRKYSSNSFVIQCEGNILQDNELLVAFAEDIASLQSAGVNIIVIHDGNNVVNTMMDKLAFKGAAANLYSADHANVEIVEMILSGHVNKKIVTQINQAGGSAVGISGKDGKFMLARRAKLARYDYSSNDKVLNFGFLGELSLVNPEILFSLEEHNLIPVISPITVGDDGRTYKIDPHDISGALAAVLGATKLIFISDLPGIVASENQVLKEINATQITKLINNDDEENADLSSKLRSSLMALEHSTESIHIINGKIPHALMLQLFTEDSVGTTIIGNKQQSS